MLKRLTGNENFELDIMNKMNSLGYSMDMKGICRGLQRTWIQAVLCGEESKVLRRVILIYITKNLPVQIKIAQLKKGNLSNEDQLYIDILAFFDAIKLYQSFFYSDIFEKFLFQSDSEMISKVIMSQALEKQGGMANVFFTSFAGNKSEVENFLIELKTLIQSLGPANTEPLVISLNAQVQPQKIGHSTGFYYDMKEDCWKFFNSNRMSQSLKKFTDSELALEMMKAYGLFPKTTTLSNFDSLDDATKNAIFEFDIEVFTTGQKKEVVQKFFDEFSTSTISTESIINGILSNDYKLLSAALNNKMTSTIDEVLLTLEKIGFNRWNEVDKDGKSLAHHIIAHGDYFKTLNKLSANTIDWTKPDNSGTTPTHLAVGGSNYEALAWLIQQIKDWNVPAHDKATPSTVAVYMGNLKAIKMITPYVDWNQSCLDDNTYAHIAAFTNQVAVLEFFLNKGIDLNIPNKDGQTPAYWAMMFGRLDAFKFLIKHIDLNKPDSNGKTLAQHAAEQGKIQMLDLLNKNQSQAPKSQKT